MTLLFSILYVGLGGCIGSITRYTITFLLQSYQLVFPVATLCANLGGSFLMGLVVGLSLRQSFSPELFLFLATGICGGFTTLSTLVYDVNTFADKGEFGRASLYVFMSFAGAYALFLLGAFLAKKI